MEVEPAQTHVLRCQKLDGPRGFLDLDRLQDGVRNVRKCQGLSPIWDLGQRRRHADVSKDEWRTRVLNPNARAHGPCAGDWWNRLVDGPSFDDVWVSFDPCPP